MKKTPGPKNFTSEFPQISKENKHKHFTNSGGTEEMEAFPTYSEKTITSV